MVSRLYHLMFVGFMDLHLCLWGLCSSASFRLRGFAINYVPTFKTLYSIQIDHQLPWEVEVVIC